MESGAWMAGVDGHGRQYGKRPLTKELVDDFPLHFVEIAFL